MFAACSASGQGIIDDHGRERVWFVRHRDRRSAGRFRPALQRPCVTTDSSGNVYFFEHGAGRIRKVSPSGIISTVAGSGTYGVSGDGGPGAEGELGRRRPAGLVRPDTRLDGSFASQTARSASPTLQPPKSVACRSTRESFKATGSGVSGFGGLGDGRPVSSATFSSSEGLGLRPSHLRAECFAGQNIGYLPE